MGLLGWRSVLAIIRRGSVVVAGVRRGVIITPVVIRRDVIPIVREIIDVSVARIVPPIAAVPKPITTVAAPGCARSGTVRSTSEGKIGSVSG